MVADPGGALRDRLQTDLGHTPHPHAAASPARPVPLPARTHLATLAYESVAAASLAAADAAGARPTPLDPDRIAVAYSSERHFRLDGVPMQAWAPLSGFFRSSDGWVRTHGNYPHHADALRRALELGADADADAVAAALRSVPAETASRAVTRAGGLCVPVRHEHPALDAEHRSRPLVHVTRIASSPARPRAWGHAAAPLQGVRVLDLTRVIAGPVATRTLALLGADVLRIDPPRLPEPEWQHLDSGHGKRSALLDLTVGGDRDSFEHLLHTADVVVTGYRPTAFERIGLSPVALAARRPGIVVARLTAWGATGPAADRRGFDSLVQAATGIAWIESGGEHPGALPAQGLDHSAGYLLAAGAITTLLRQADEGGSWSVEISLRRVAAELLGMPRSDTPQPSAPAPDATGHVQRFDLDGRQLITAGPAIAYAGGPTRFPAPRRWGRDAAVWLDA